MRSLPEWHIPTYYAALSFPTTIRSKWFRATKIIFNLIAGVGNRLNLTALSKRDLLVCFCFSLQSVAFALAYTFWSRQLPLFIYTPMVCDLQSCWTEKIKVVTRNTKKKFIKYFCVCFLFSYSCSYSTLKYRQSHMIFIIISFRLAVGHFPCFPRSI